MTRYEENVYDDFFFPFTSIICRRRYNRTGNMYWDILEKLKEKPKGNIESL